MSQSALASVAGITRNAVANYEVGRSEPTFETLCQFANALGVDVSDLVTEHLEFPNNIRRLQVTDDESALIQAYREAEPTYQVVAMDILRAHRKR